MSEQAELQTVTDEVAPAQRKRRSLSHAVAARAALVVAIGYAYFAYACLGPGDLEAIGPTYVSLWYAAFLARTFMFHAGLAFVAVAGLVLVFRRFRLLLLCVPLVVAGVGPDVLKVWPGSVAAGGADFRLMSFNLMYTHTDAAPLVDEVVAADADVVLLQEYTPLFHDAFKPAMRRRYPYSICQPAEDAFGAAIYSKLPFVEGSRRAGAVGLGVLAAPCVTLRAEGRDIALYNVHLVPPRHSLLPYMRRQFAELSREVRDEKGSTIVAGDFNFNGRSRMNRAMLELGLFDAHESAGVGRGTTWPNRGPLRHLPGVRIDHVFLSDGLRATACCVGDGHGSDHRPIIVGVRVEPE